MRILLDENLPAMSPNCRLPAFHAILTADQSIRYQQNRRNGQAALIVLSDNDESVIVANVKTILAAIDVIQPGALLSVELDVGHED